MAYLQCAQFKKIQVVNMGRTAKEKRLLGYSVVRLFFSGTGLKKEVSMSSEGLSFSMCWQCYCISAVGYNKLIL